MSHPRPTRGGFRLFPVVAVALAIAGPARAQGSQGKVLLLAPTVSGGAGSLEYAIVTSPGPVPAIPSLTGLGLGADVVTPAQWAAMPTSAFSAYRAIVLGDPSCGSTVPAPVAAAEANVAAWTPAVTGNVVVIGTDPTLHAVNGRIVRGAQLWKSAIQFAVSGAGTGAVIALSCYYNTAAANTLVNVLTGFGAFRVTGNVPCSSAVAIVAASPALTGLTGGPTGTLSSWGCSVHEWFNSWPAGFIPLAVATDITTPPPTFTAVNGTRGHPYILARGDIRAVGDTVTGLLKVCKVAGPGTPVGTRVAFTTSSGPVTVQAGPAPGGYCAVGPTFVLGTVVTVTEIATPGGGVGSIAVAPAGRLARAPDLTAGRVRVTIGSGVTEVTFTNGPRTGFLEICKRGDVPASSSFTLSPGGAGPVVVPAGACSPAIELPAGVVVIREAPAAGSAMAGCSTIPANRQGACSLTARTSTVTVPAGDVSTQTIATILNRRTTDTIPRDTTRRDTIPRDTARRDSLGRVTLRRDSLFSVRASAAQPPPAPPPADHRPPNQDVPADAGVPRRD